MQHYCQQVSEIFKALKHLFSKNNQVENKLGLDKTVICKFCGCEWLTLVLQKLIFVEGNPNSQLERKNERKKERK